MATKARGPGINFGNSPFDGRTPARKAGDEPAIVQPYATSWALATDVEPVVLEMQRHDHPRDGRSCGPCICDDH